MFKKKIKNALTLSRFRKYGLHAERTILCAVKLQLSQASVTSTKSSTSLSWRTELRMLDWKSFHLREYCCSPPVDEDEEAAMASVPLRLTTRGAIVLALLVTLHPWAPLHVHQSLSFHSHASVLYFFKVLDSIAPEFILRVSHDWSDRNAIVRALRNRSSQISFTQWLLSEVKANKWKLSAQIKVGIEETSRAPRWRIS